MLDQSSSTTTPLDAVRAAEVAKNGFIHLKHVLPAARVAEALELAHEVGATENFHGSKIFEILLEELQVQRLVQSLFSEKIHYLGWSSVMLDRKADVADLHDDAKGPAIAKEGNREAVFNVHTRPHNPAKHPTWPVYRLFIYLQNHKIASGGTKVKKESHKKHFFYSAEGRRALLKGKFKHVMFPGIGYVNPEVEPGDAVLFNLRYRHSGHNVRLRAPFNRISLPPMLDNLIKRIGFRMPFGKHIMKLIARDFPEKRTSLVVDFCLESDWARGFQLNRMIHNRERRAQFYDVNDPAFVARLEKVGLPVLENKNLEAVAKFINAA